MKCRYQWGTFVLLCFLGMALMMTPAFAEEMSENNLLQNGGGGIFCELFKLDVTELNSILENGGFGTFNDWMITYGGGLFSQTEQNFRYSNFFAKGRLITSGQDGKTARLSLTHGGVWLDQMVPLLPDLAVSAGGSLSLGGMKLELVHHQISSIDEGVLDPQETVMTVPSFMIKPEVGLHYSLKRYVDIELKLGYYYSHILGKWKQGGQRIEQGVQPLKQTNGPSVMVHFNFGF